MMEQIQGFGYALDTRPHTIQQHTQQMLLQGMHVQTAIVQDHPKIECQMQESAHALADNIARKGYDYDPQLKTVLGDAGSGKSGVVLYWALYLLNHYAVKRVLEERKAELYFRVIDTGAGSVAVAERGELENPHPNYSAPDFEKIYTAMMAAAAIGLTRQPLLQPEKNKNTGKLKIPVTLWESALTPVIVGGLSEIANPQVIVLNANPAAQEKTGRRRDAIRAAQLHPTTEKIATVKAVLKATNTRYTANGKALSATDLVDFPLQAPLSGIERRRNVTNLAICTWANTISQKYRGTTVDDLQNKPGLRGKMFKDYATHLLSTHGISSFVVTDMLKDYSDTVEINDDHTLVLKRLRADVNAMLVLFQEV